MLYKYIYHILSSAKVYKYFCLFLPSSVTYIKERKNSIVDYQNDYEDGDRAASAKSARVEDDDSEGLKTTKEALSGRIVKKAS